MEEYIIILNQTWKLKQKTRSFKRRNQAGMRKKKDTEEVSFPPIKHVEPECDIVKVDFALNPVHI